MNDLTLIIPAKNEKESLPSVLEEIEKLNCNITVSLKEDDIDTINSIKIKKSIYIINLVKAMEIH
tara:strand:- start:381 stop:575 length:195 start_codon:yes stop_codon:yes gene_type:complete